MQIAMIGLGRMGAGISRRLISKGHSVIGYDHNPDAVAALVKDKGEGAKSLEDVARQLQKPRTAWVMLPAGDPTEETVKALGGIFEKGDIVIDGGNSFYKDDIRRAKMLREKGIHHVDVGTSGGVWGVVRGFCMMIGGEKDVVSHLDRIFKAMAPGLGSIERTKGYASDARAEQGYMHAGPNGAGHFVKMVHNGIEYGLMQAYAEGFDVLRGKSHDSLHPDEQYDLNLPEVAEVWRRGSVISSWLLDLTSIALSKSPKLEEFKGFVDDSGEGRWTIQAAIEEAVPVNVLSAALYARFRSRVENSFGDKLLSAMRNEFGGHVEGALEKGMAPKPKT